MDLAQPGKAEQIGLPLRDKLKGCRRVHIGNDHRLIYMVRETDVVVVNIGLRKDKAVYAEAEKALVEVESLAPARRGNGTGSTTSGASE